MTLGLTNFGKCVIVLKLESEITKNFKELVLKKSVVAIDNIYACFNSGLLNGINASTTTRGNKDMPGLVLEEKNAMQFPSLTPTGTATTLSTMRLPCVDVLCRVEQTLATPELASDWLKRYVYPKQRQIRQRQVKRLAEAQLRGTFKSFTDIELTQVAGKGDWQLTDGQHRLHSIILSGKSQWLIVKWRDVDTEAERADVYGRTDRGLPRTTRDNLIAHELYNDMGLTKTQVSALQAAVRVLASGFVQHSSLYYAMSDELLMDGMRDFQTEAARFFEAIAGGDSSLTGRLSSSPSLAVALMTFRHQPEIADAFWKRIAANSGLIMGEPEHCVVRLLVKHTIKTLGVPKYGRSIASAWNAHMDGRQIALLAANAAKPIRLVGTPYTGRENRFYMPPAHEEDHS